MGSEDEVTGLEQTELEPGQGQAAPPGAEERCVSPSEGANYWDA